MIASGAAADSLRRIASIATGFESAVMEQDGTFSMKNKRVLLSYWVAILVC